MNIAIIQGRPTRDPTIERSNDGKTVYSRARVAVEGPWRGPNAPRRVGYFTVVFFGKQAQRYYDKVAKGALITVAGRLDQREYIDKLGNKREEVTIIAEKLTVHELLRKNRELVMDGVDDLVPREITDSLFKQIDYDDADFPEEEGGNLNDPLHI